MSELTLEQALEGLGVKADDVLDSRVFPDRVVVILRSGPKLSWPLPVPVRPAAVPERPEVKASDEARRVAAEMGIDLKTVEGSGVGGKISAKDVRLAAQRKSSDKGKG